MPAKEVIRNDYLDTLDRLSRFPELIRIVVGVRRCGKSTLYRMLSESMSDSNIIVFDMEMWNNRKYRNPEVLYNKVE